MMPNSRTNSANQQSPAHRSKPQAPANAYRPSVPISVYRELANELQHKETQLKSVKAHNHKLLQQNQRLQHEIENLFLSAQNLQELAATHDAYGNPVAIAPEPIPVRPSPPSPSAPPSPPPTLEPPKPPQKQVAEVEEKASRRPSQPESSSEVSGWVVGMAIALIVLIAFGTGFLVMRPLLKK